MVNKYRIFKYANDKLVLVSKSDFESLERAKLCCENDCKAIADRTKTDTITQYIITTTFEEGGKRIILEIVTETAQPRTNSCNR